MRSAVAASAQWRSSTAMTKGPLLATASTHDPYGGMELVLIWGGLRPGLRLVVELHGEQPRQPGQHPIDARAEQRTQLGSQAHPHRHLGLALVETQPGPHDLDQGTAGHITVEGDAGASQPRGVRGCHCLELGQQSGLSDPGFP